MTDINHFAKQNFDVLFLKNILLLQIISLINKMRALIILVDVDYQISICHYLGRFIYASIKPYFEEGKSPLKRRFKQLLLYVEDCVFPKLS